MVFEPAVAYLPAPEPSTHTFIEQSRSGVSKKKTSEIAALLGLSVADLCYILHISERTWQRYSENEKLSTELSEKVVF